MYLHALLEMCLRHPFIFYIKRLLHFEIFGRKELVNCMGTETEGVLIKENYCES